MEQNKKEKNIKFIIKIIRMFFIFILIISILNIIYWYKNNKETENIMNDISSAVIVEIKQEDLNITDEEKNTNIENEVVVDTQLDPQNKIKNPISSENKIESNEIKEETIINEKKYKIDFEYLKKQNPDIMGWIKVEGTKIEYPVVKTSDNNYYLNHNLYKKKSKSGWIFADYRNKLDENDKNIIIYGHNRRDDSMFGTLEKILLPSWYEKEENRKIIFITENEYSIYETFSVYQTQNQNESYYVTTDFYDLEYEEFITNIKNRSIVNFEKQTNTNPILTLSTCTDDSKNRIVLHAQKIENN